MWSYPMLTSSLVGFKTASAVRAGHTLSFNLRGFSLSRDHTSGTYGPSSGCAHSQLGSPCYSFSLKCSPECSGGSVGPLRGGILREVLGSLGERLMRPQDFFFLFCSFVSWPEQAILLCCTSTMSVLHYPKLKGKGRLRSGTSGCTSSNNPSPFINCLCRVFC